MLKFTSMAQEVNPVIREQGLAEQSYSTAAPLRTVSGFIRFPNDVRGKHILDVGGGASTATLELRKQGALAFAIDYRYKDLRGLKKSVDNQLNQITSSSNIPSADQLKRDMEKELEQLERNPLPGANPALWALTGKLTAEYMRRMPTQLLRRQLEMTATANKEYAKTGRRTRDYFFGSFDNGERPYVAAMSGNLPFKDGSFDFVFSLLSVTFFLASDRDVFMKSMEEMVRVVKNGGELQIHPWIGNPMVNWTVEQTSNFREAQHFLSSKSLRYRIEPVSPTGSPRLRLLKP